MSERQLLLPPAVSWDTLLQGFHTVAWRQHHHELCTHDRSVPGSWGGFAVVLGSLFIIDIKSMPTMPIDIKSMLTPTVVKKEDGGRDRNCH